MTLEEWMQLDMWTDTFKKQKREVNLVIMWEGIDTQIPAGQMQGWNCLTKFAIHILSIVANSTAYSEPTPSTAAADTQLTQPPSSTKPPEMDMGMLDVANFDDIAEELVQAAVESDRLTKEEQDTDKGLLTSPPNPPTQPSTSRSA
ncbi:hypothetical protein BJV74DRAFT_890819 [Russula compacta]|nr:hypothetical protein BJV74DRAFT_890819 [Russula compacta]